MGVRGLPISFLLHPDANSPFDESLSVILLRAGDARILSNGHDWPREGILSF